MKEVLVVADRLGTGGVERVVTNIVTGLAKTEFKVYLFLLEKVKCEDLHCVNFPNIVVIDKFEDCLAKTHKEKRILLFNMIRNFLVKHLKVQAVHVHCANQAPEVLIAAKLRGTPVICMHSHASYSKYWNPKLFPIKVRLVHPLFQCVYRTIPTHKIGCSKNACHSMFGKSKNQFVIPNGIDLEKFNPDNYCSRKELCSKYNLDEEKRFIVFIGRLCAHKNPFFMLKVFNCLLQKDKKFHLMIIGYGELENEIQKKVKEMGISSDVSFFPPDSIVPEFLKISECLIVPSICEGLGIVFVEAQLMGILAFASEEVPREADLGMCEFLTLEDGAEKYAAQVYDCLKDKQKYKLDQKRVEQYDMKKIVKIYERIYAGCI